MTQTQPQIASIDIQTPDQMKQINLSQQQNPYKRPNYQKTLTSYRNSFSESFNESISHEKTVNKDDMKNLMPSQRLAFLNRKKSHVDESTPKSSLRTSQPAQDSCPKFTKTGLMIAQGDPSSRDKSKDRPRKSKIFDQRKNSPPPLEPIKEQVSDLKYLKSIKSKVDCWAPKQPLLNKKESEEDNNDKKQ